MSWSIEFTKLPAPAECVFIAGANPVQFSILRKDITGFSITEQVTPSPTGQIRLTFTGEDLRSYFSAGRKVVVSGVSGSYDDKYGTIIGRDFSSGDTHVHIDIPYINNSSSSSLYLLFEDVTPTYYVEVSWAIDVVNKGKMVVIPNRFGKCTFDLSDVCKAKNAFQDPFFPDFSFNEHVAVGLQVYVHAFWDTDIAMDWGFGFPPGDLGNAGLLQGSVIVPLPAALSIGVVKAAKQTTDIFKNNFRRYFIWNYFDIPVTANWTQAGMDWAFASDIWSISENSGITSSELKFVDGPTLPPGFYMLGCLFEILQMGGPKEVVRILFYDFEKLVQVSQFDVPGVQATPGGFQENLEFYVSKPFNIVKIQVFNPGPILVNGFKLNVLRFATTMKMLTLFNSKEMIIWRNMPFTFNFLANGIFNDAIIGGGTSFRMRWFQYREDGSNINDSTATVTHDFGESANPLMVFGPVTKINIKSHAYDGNAQIPYLHPEAAKLVITLEILSKQYSESFVLNVKEWCDNSVYLYWKNSLGGDSYWLFEYSQDYEYRHDDGRKTRRMTLFADNLTPEQWDALNDINRPTQVTDVYTEDFTVQNRTSQQDGANIFIIDRQMNLTGVVCIPTDYVYETRAHKRSIKITLELPTMYVP